MSNSLSVYNVLFFLFLSACPSSNIHATTILLEGILRDDRVEGRNEAECAAVDISRKYRLPVAIQSDRQTGWRATVDWLNVAKQTAQLYALSTNTMECGSDSHKFEDFFWQTNGPHW